MGITKNTLSEIVQAYGNNDGSLDIKINAIKDSLLVKVDSIDLVNDINQLDSIKNNDPIEIVNESQKEIDPFALTSKL